MLLVWCSILQLRMGLSSIETEFVSLSACLRNAMPIMNLVKKISTHAQIEEIKPNTKCKLFEENESCKKIAKSSILTPRAKRAVLKYHHFQSCADEGSITLESIRTGEQNVDIRKKLVAEPQLTCLRKKLNGY